MNVTLRVQDDEHVHVVIQRCVHPQVLHILRLAQDLPQQRTPEWFAQRNNMITASEVAAVLGVSKFQSRNVALRNKVGAILGSDQIGSKFCDNFITKWGNTHEDMVRDRFCTEYNEVAHEVGCIPHATIPILGASPDGVLESGALVEIKCPYKRVIDPNVVPLQYWHQMQLQMEVCNLNLCYYVEWAPAMEFFDPTKDIFSVQEVHRDTGWLSDNWKCIQSFWEDVQHYVNNPELAIQDLASRKRRKLEKAAIEFV